MASGHRTVKTDWFLSNMWLRIFSCPPPCKCGFRIVELGMKAALSTDVVAERSWAIPNPPQPPETAAVLTDKRQALYNQPRGDN